MILEIKFLLDLY